jgi:hypothetical protein
LTRSAGGRGRRNLPSHPLRNRSKADPQENTQINETLHITTEDTSTIPILIILELSRVNADPAL